MALPSPLKHPSPLAASLTSPISPNATLNSQFTPRKEFLRDDRITSSFSLLALSGAASVRLYSFPRTIVDALQRLFDQHNLVAGVREQTKHHFYEFTLVGKPWTNPKSIKAEKLIVDILAVVLHYGFAFLTTIDYGRENDDRIAMAFSKQQITTSPNASAVSLNHPTQFPFALSFCSATVVRVIGAPLHATPAILQAVRAAWPRGVVSEEKVGDATYEFKMKGYRWFQEDTFSTDSLHQILYLLQTLDVHGFSLLASLSLISRSRVKDLWIFTGPPDETRSNTTPNTSSLELKREITPQTHVASIPFSSPLPTLPEDRSQKSRNIGPNPNGHIRSTSDTTPLTSSPLKNFTGSSMSPMAVLRRSSHKAQTSASIAPEHPTKGLPQLTDTVSPDKSPSVGSIDMTGVGSGQRRSMDMPRTPDVLYTTDERPNNGPLQHQHHQLQGRTAPYPAFTAALRHRRTSSDSKYPPFTSSQDMSWARVASPETLSPRPISRQPSTPTVPPPRISIIPPSQNQTPTSLHAPSPMHIFSQGHLNGDSSHHVRKDSKHSPKEPVIDTPRTPTPPLLGPGIFRDSAYTSGTGRGQSCEIPITWTGKYPEHEEKPRAEERETEREQDRHGQSHVPSLGPPTGARSPAPRDDRNDVVYMLPPTIKEQFSQEGSDYFDIALLSRKPDLLTPSKMEGVVRSMSPEHVQPHGDGARKSEAATLGVLPGESSKSTPTKGTPVPMPGAAKDKGRVHSPKRLDSGWVMVNIEPQAGKSQDKGKEAKKHTKTSSASPSTNLDYARPVRRTRSNSDSRIPTSRGLSPQIGNAPSPASMSAAAKAIVMIDAIDARKAEHDKPGAGSGLKRLFGRRKVSPHTNDHTAAPPAVTISPALRHKVPEGGITKTRAIELEERERERERDRIKRRGVPEASRRDKRRSID